MSRLRYYVVNVLIFGLLAAPMYLLPNGPARYVHLGHWLVYSSPFVYVLIIWAMPGLIAALPFYYMMGGLPNQAFDAAYPVRSSLVIVYGIVVSWFFWPFFLSRLWFFIGLYDPFATYHGRPKLLRAMMWLSGNSDAAKFGKQSTGGWASLWEVMCWRWQAGDIFLGRPTFRSGLGLLRPIGIPTDKHMVTIAGAGSGKSTAGLAPNLCLHEGSLLCIDPKGELARITAARRGQGGGGVRGMGQPVHVVDPFGITGMPSACYNVFDELAAVGAQDPDAVVGYAGKIAEALIEITGRDPYWDTAARTVIIGLILHIYQGPPERRNLMHLRRLLMEGDVEAFEKFAKAGELDRSRNTPFDALLAEMSQTPDGPHRDMVAGSAASLMRMPPNQQGSVLSTAQSHTAFLDDPKIKKVSGRSDFLLAQLKEYPTSVYLCVPINMISGLAGRWLRMYVLLLIDMMMRVQVAPKPPILMAIDEFPNLGKLDGIEVVAPVMRSYGVRLWVVGQGIEQFKKVYPESWMDFIGNAEAVQFMGVKDMRTVKMIVEFLGQHPVEPPGARRSGEPARDRNLLDENQVARFLLRDRKRQIVWRGDRKPMVLRITPYFQYLPAWYYSRDPNFRESFRRWIWRWGSTRPVNRPRPEELAPVVPAWKPEIAEPFMPVMPPWKPEISGFKPAAFIAPAKTAVVPADDESDIWKPRYDRPWTWAKPGDKMYEPPPAGSPPQPESDAGFKASAATPWVPEHPELRALLEEAEADMQKKVERWVNRTTEGNWLSRRLWRKFYKLQEQWRDQGVERRTRWMDEQKRRRPR